jgi:hypothetical protein
VKKETLRPKLKKIWTSRDALTNAANSESLGSSESALKARRRMPAIARPLGATSENVGTPFRCAHLAAGAASKVGQTAKARSGYRVQSLPKGRDRQCQTILSIAVPLEWSKVHDSSTVRTFSDVDRVLKIA